MKHFSLDSLLALPKRYRANLINSCAGYKTANLIATKGTQGTTNVAVFNSVVHIGSNPPMLGFILRPTTVPRNTYQNIKDTNSFTINQINAAIIEDAHHTAAKYDVDISEFDKTDLTEEYLDDFHAPYVKQSHIKIGCTYVNEYHIKENDTILIIGAIEHLYLNEEAIESDGWIHLDKSNTVSIVGLDGYALPSILDRYDYPRPDQKVTSIYTDKP
ncbi:flavin reductase family protein [Aquimarina brevivitae]|uniref:Flavin reductase (DIM6/NTAB) family NADH-FMN oxidoreductase RutF n=1 Tax=Aquimarina brevivitae TaxID=323412 RepID=A0A4Q7NX49_9FLAO|nr:flavin reductase [Aquimarina brevivitae]RZS91933.1 flavin reductase (DIM6/NTAB) family NADH-FMN oxidoreductase RutF [Aquimarina brevivitae]